MFYTELLVDKTTFKHRYAGSYILLTSSRSTNTSNFIVTFKDRLQSTRGVTDDVVIKIEKWLLRWLCDVKFALRSEVEVLYSFTFLLTYSAGSASQNVSRPLKLDYESFPGLSPIIFSKIAQVRFHCVAPVIPGRPSGLRSVGRPRWSRSDPLSFFPNGPVSEVWAL